MTITKLVYCVAKLPEMSVDDFRDYRLNRHGPLVRSLWEKGTFPGMLRYVQSHTIYEADGGRTLEYPRQPEGRSNLMITIGSDGRMSALRQVLTEANFARIQPGMRQDEVRRLLGKPAKTQRYLPAREEAWDWRFRSGAENRVFSVVFGFDGVVLRSASAIDPRELYAGD